MRVKAIVYQILLAGITHIPKPAAPLWSFGFILALPFASAVGAEPRLETDALIGPLSNFFSAGETGAPLGSPGYLLGADHISRNLFDKEVKVDSNFVKYMIRAGGAPSGPSLTLDIEDHLQLSYQRDLVRIWRQRVRQDLRQTSEKQVRGGRSRFEWSVNLSPPSRHLRRLIGDVDPTLKIHGQLKTTIGGKSQWTEGEVQTAAGRTSKFPSLSLDQDQRFTVEGKVGEFINIRIDQDTQSIGSSFGSSMSDKLANQIKLDYKGDEDAIFQEIQAGNTTLSLPGTKFVGFRQQHKGLFGIRARGRLGPLGFTTIASHEKSKGNRRTFKGGARADTTEKRDYEYVRNKYFFLDSFYRDNLPDFRRAALGSQIRPDDVVDPITLEIYINDFNIRNDAEMLAREGVAWVDPKGPIIEESGFVERGTWHRLDPDDDYVLVAGGGYFILNRNVGEREALAVSYRTMGGQQFGDTRGDTLKLKLLKAQDARPNFPTWDLEWKNVYQIASSFQRGKKFTSDAIEVQILKEVPGREPQASQDGKSYLQIFGLDEHGQDPGSPPDRRIDVDYAGLDEWQGMLILPDLTPFDPQHPNYKDGLKDPVPGIYETQLQRDKIEASRYIIQVISSSTQQRISLGLGVNPASVEVLLNGERLQPGSDYNVGFAGDVTFTANAASRVGSPGADLEINYESEDLFGLGSQQKTLLGMRTEYEFWEGDGTIGSTLIYNNERTGDRRVRVGAEPARTIVWDMDLRARFKAPLLTRLVDIMPLIKTAAPSDINMQAEFAQSRPNLNTKGTGFVDDFEGSERFNALPVLRSRWTMASIPAGETDVFNEENRGRMIWYNPINQVPRIEIWPGQEDQIEAGNNLTDVLTLELESASDAGQSWGGVMRAFSSVADLSQSKFLELWLRGERGKLHIDLGSISEDVNNDGRLNTEDIPIGGMSTGDGQVSPEEDIGIDGRDLAGELNYYLELAGVDTTGLEIREKQEQFGHLYPDRDPEDPEGDNWAYDRKRNEDDYSRINGTEGNRDQDAMGSQPDTEDLNNDGQREIRNDYYHYTIDLAFDPHVPGTESEGWRLFRLPLYGNQVGRVGNPDSSRVEFARLVASGVVDTADEPLKMEIALLEIIENQWQEDEVVVLGDAFAVGPEEGLNVTVIGTDKNIEYSPPPRVHIRKNLNSRTREREQSLVLDYQNLEPGHQVSVTRVLQRNSNYTKYTRLRMYVHGDTEDESYVVNGDSSDIELFVRFGADSTNYYEFISRVFPGWENRRNDWRGNEVDVDLLEMAHLKGRLQNLPPDSTGQFHTLLDTVISKADLRDGEPAIYRVRGNPSMQQIRQLSIGLRNRSDMQIYSGRVFVNELRLDEARNDPGIAAYFKVNTNLADFMNVDAEVTWREEDFRTINDTGRNSSDLSTNFNTKTQLDRFLPGRWAFSMPLRVKFSRTESLPRFGPNSDVELTKTQKQQQRSQRTSEFYEFQMSRRAGQNWLLRWTIDQMSLGSTYSKDRSFSSTQPVNNVDSQSMNFKYQMPLPKPSVQPLRWTEGLFPESLANLKVNYLPSSIAYSMGANRKETARLRRADSDTTFHETFTMNENYSAKINPLNGLSSNYTLKVRRDLRKKFTLGAFSFGREVKRSQKADLKFRLRLVRWLEQNYTFQANYDELNDPSRRTVRVAIDTTTGAPLATRDINTKNNLSAKFNLKLPAFLKSIGQPGKGQKSESKDAGKPFILWRLLNATGRFADPVNGTWRRDGSGNNFNIIARPSLAYQLGFEDSLRVPRAMVSGLTQQDQWSQIETWDISSGLKLPLGFSIKPSFNRKVTRRSGSTQTRLRVEEQRVFPKANISWSKADRLPFIKKIINSSQVSITYKTTRGRQGEGSLAVGNLISEGKTTEFTTSWNGRIRIGPTVTVKRTFSSSTDKDFELASFIDTTQVQSGGKPLRGSSSQEKSITTISTSYNLKPRGLPLLGKLKSNVDLKYEFGLERAIRASATSNAERAPISDIDKWKTSLRATYKFSDNFRGEAIIRLENSQNNLTDKTRKTREVRMSGTLFFR